jgi:hypothetical protein
MALPTAPCWERHFCMMTLQIPLAGMLGTTEDKPEDADAVYAELMGRARRCYVQPSVLAIAAAAAGIEDKAIRHAREAFGDP